jgi:putative transposase
MTKTKMDAMETASNVIKMSHSSMLLQTLVRALTTVMDGEASALCGAAYGERSDERSNSRNGYRERVLETRMGTVDLQIPKLRQGSYHY